MTFVPELKRNLSPGQLAVWVRRGTMDCTDKDRRFIDLWLSQAKGNKPSKVRSLPVIDCPHLGAATGETVQCRRCKRLAPVATFHCAKHGLCTQHEYPAARKDGGNLVDDVKCCKNCSDNPANRRVANADTTYPGKYPAVGAKHLIYHLLPVAGRWQGNVDELLKRWPLFTGRKVIAIMTGGAFSRGKGQGETDAKFTLDPPAMVKAAFPPDAEFIELPNDPKLREVASWGPLVEKVLATADDADAVFYGHAKGVTRAAMPDDWTRWMYETCLDYPEKVDSLLGTHPIVGSFKKTNPSFSGRSRWHYSGTFFWFRAGDMKGRPWRNVPKEWWGVEGWAGIAYAVAEGGVIFKNGTEFDLFKPECVDEVRSELAAWRETA